MEINDYLVYVADVAHTMVKYNEGDIQIIEGIAEVEINGIEYQAQIILEPKKNNWVHSDKPTIRQTME